MNEPPPAGGEASGSAAAKDIYSYSDLVVVSTGTFAARDRVLCPVGQSAGFMVGKAQVS